MSLEICSTQFVRRCSQISLGRGPIWLISPHLDIFISNCILLGMSRTSLLVRRLGQTQLGRGHENTLIHLRTTPSDGDSLRVKSNTTKILLMTNFFTNKRVLFFRQNRG